MRSLAARTTFAFAALATVLTLSLVASEAAKADPTPTATPAPAPAPTNPPDCQRDFILQYVTTSGLVRSLAPYLEANETAPALTEAAYACFRIATKYPNHECSFKNAKETVIPKTADLQMACGEVTKLFLQAGGSLLPRPVTNDSPFGSLNSESFRITVAQPQALQALINQPLMSFAVNGQVMSLQDSMNSSASVRCGVERSATALLFPLASYGQTLEGVFSYETFTAGVRTAHLAIANGTLVLTCTKEAKNSITLGDIRAAFGPILQIDYAQ